MNDHSESNQSLSPEPRTGGVKALVLAFAVVLLAAAVTFFWVRRNQNPQEAAPVPSSSSSSVIILAAPVTPLRCGAFQADDAAKVDIALVQGWMKHPPQGDKNLLCEGKEKQVLENGALVALDVRKCDCVAK